MSLTRRQAQIIAMCASGGTLRQIAIDLGLTYPTTRNLAQQAKSRLGASTLAQAAVLALWTGDCEITDTGSVVPRPTSRLVHVMSPVEALAPSLWGL